ncbi:MAG: glutamyl-tRNA reductase [Francisellaceae bacterium]|nr:glutamyl-tRNA reductase [Francisellaceae bacterium]
MRMVLLAIGLNHKTATLSIREKFIINPDKRKSLLVSIIQSKLADEAVWLSTCNRTEIYCYTRTPRALIRWLKKQQSLKMHELKIYIYSHSDILMVRHLLRVASGLDSMILGETEILGQMKQAYQEAQSIKSLGRYLGRLFPFAFSVAKTIRNKTMISNNSISAAACAVKLSQNIFSDLKDASALLVGAGDMIRISALHLIGLKVKKIFLANRTIDKAQILIDDLLNKTKSVTPIFEIITLEKIPEFLWAADIIIVATHAPLPLIGKGMIETALKQRKHKPVFIADLGVPRNVEPEVSTLEDAYLYAIDDLHTIIQENQRSRSEAALHAEQMIIKESECFMKWLKSHHALNTIKNFREKCIGLRDEALEKAKQDLKKGQNPEMILKNMAYKLLNQFMHIPTLQLRRAAFENDENMLTLARQLYNLSDG